MCVGRIKSYRISGFIAFVVRVYYFVFWLLEESLGFGGSGRWGGY